jgi:integrase
MPKRVPPLSAKTLSAVRATNKTIELIDGHLPGLRVRILPTGTKSWSLNVRDRTGARRRFDIGCGLGLAEARRKAEDLRRAIRDGADPTSERRAARQRTQAAQQGRGTINELLETYFTKGPGAQRRRARKHKRLVQTVFSKVLDWPMLDVSGPELQLIADGWRSPATASLAVRLIRPCLKWAERRGLVRTGIANLEQPGTVHKRERVLSTDELKAIWPLLSGNHGLVLKWLLLTGCRLNEAAGLSWGEINEDKWTIPAARAKNNRQRVVPLPRQAMALLQAQPPGDPTALAFPSERGSMLSNWDRETKRLHRLSGTTGWHRHDLRRTVATLLGDLGYAPHVVGVVLGHAHTAEGATAVYARSRYHREHAEALQALADEIDRITCVSNSVVHLANS